MAKGVRGGKYSGSMEEQKVMEPEVMPFKYERSADLKEWSAAEEKRSNEMSKYVNDKLRAGDGDFGEYYEEHGVETLSKIAIPGDSIFNDDELTITKMNIIYAQDWDENERRVKQGKAVTGSTYYVVETMDGSIDETNFAYKTKADAEHAAKLYLDRLSQWRKYRQNKRNPNQ